MILHTKENTSRNIILSANASIYLDNLVSLIGSIFIRVQKVRVLYSYLHNQLDRNEITKTDNKPTSVGEYHYFLGLACVNV